MEWDTHSGWRLCLAEETWYKESRFRPNPHGKDTCHTPFYLDIISQQQTFLSSHLLSPHCWSHWFLPVSSAPSKVTLSTFQAEVASVRHQVLGGAEWGCAIHTSLESAALSFWTMCFTPQLIRLCLGTSPIMPILPDQPFDLLTGAPAKCDCAWVVRCQSSSFWIQWFLMRVAQHSCLDSFQNAYTQISFWEAVKFTLQRFKASVFWGAGGPMWFWERLRTTGLDWPLQIQQRESAGYPPTKDD